CSVRNLPQQNTSPSSIPVPVFLSVFIRVHPWLILLLPHPHQITSGLISSVIAPSTSSCGNTPLNVSSNSHMYSCRNHRSPIVARSSSRCPFRIRPHSVAGARNRSHSGPPFAHVS